MGKDAAGAEEDERHGEQKGGEARGQGEAASRRSRMRQVSERGEAGGEGGVKIMVENDASEELDDGGLNEEGAGRVGEGKVAVGKLAEGDAGGVFEDVAEIPEHGEVSVLPEHEGGRGEEEKRPGEEIAEAKGRRGDWGSGLDISWKVKFILRQF